ncbi:Na(+)-translocating NADH-quinone reductase subunit A [Flammeovirgaceae bacterium SG7u.111]|nr:Na(+)-translocating NADH-quinone reductase subunit A [Flammeovirgaceae bacterium SG7u.132]WPO38707.1 Na(+)-translocating NADH-quinone reductase subunit A [Flammeovirgaceae bacterium SG7u.111]
MSKSIKLNKGFTINLAGKAEKKIGNAGQAKTYAIKPTDFPAMERPKVLLKEGEKVKAGTPIMVDKKVPDVQYASPVSGEIVEIKRGDKRKLLEIIIKADGEMSYEEFPKYSVSDIANLKPAEIKDIMLKGGVWPNIIQRPFAVVANPEDTPKAIFISAFDSSPLAPDYDFIFKEQGRHFELGVEILSKLTSGPVHVNIDGQAEVSQLFIAPKSITVNKFSGKHPVGNVGVQIHHLDPINKGEVAWTINPFGVIQLGKLFAEGVYDASKIIAVAGSEVKAPQYYKTYTGACVEGFLENNLNSDHVRVISGNVLSGEKIDTDGYIGFYDHLLSVIPEGDKPRFIFGGGWLSPIKNRLSMHRAIGLLSFMNSSSKEYKLDSSLNGEERAFVVSGSFEKVVPMDILPTHLIKAIMAEDYDEMEALGIYEVAEEDLALCEFVDVSKHEVQKIVRQGIELMREV